MEQRIYLDFNASTPLAPEVAEAMRPFLTEHYGNPSSPHWAGAPARAAVERARAQVAALLGCETDEIVFTSGGTESNNHALQGVFFANRDHGEHIVTSAVEHPAIRKPLQFLETLGATVTVVPVDRRGRVDPDAIRRALTPRTILVTVMHANNEVGTVQPIAEIAAIARAAGVLVHTDAAQSVGKISTRVADLGVDLLSVAGHKLYAPKGVGVLYVRRGTRIRSLVHGADHEAGRRAGTESALLDVGLGAACEIAAQWIGMPATRVLRDRFERELKAAFGDTLSVNGEGADRLPNTASVNFAGHVGAEILARLRAAMVTWVVADITAWTPSETYEVWHDRATFHFLVRREDREAYRKVLLAALRPGGHAIIGTFASDGPERCSGLPVAPYEPAARAAELGPHFHLVDAIQEQHVTPEKTVQAFQFSHLVRTR